MDHNNPTHYNNCIPNNDSVIQQRHITHRRTSSSLSSSLHVSSPTSALALRGGAAATSVLQTKTPLQFFNSALVGLFFATVCVKILARRPVSSSDDEVGDNDDGSASDDNKIIVRTLQRKFLSVFWLLRCADWLQGPYFYEVYASKMFNGVQASASLVSKLFLTGFVSTAAFGPLVGRLADAKGRKRGTMAFTVLYAIGALSTKSPLLVVLLLGRVASGMGTSLLFSAPESWLVGESQRLGVESSLGDTFGLAYAGDSIVAILAGQMAGLAAGISGPTGPFQLSVGFLALGAILAAVTWKENVASGTSQEDSDGNNNENKSSIREAMKVIASDEKILLVGAVQALFEAAMYIFVLQWPPAITAAIKTAFSGESVSTPFGTVFSCFMASCLLGSSVFSHLTGKMNVSAEKGATGMLALATVSMGLASVVTSGCSFGSSLPPFAALVTAFFAFESCVGMYFPSIGTLRSKYVPDSYRGVIMNLFGIPLNILVVTVFLSIQKLGVSGALSCSTTALGLAFLSLIKLRRVVSKEEKS